MAVQGLDYRQTTVIHEERMRSIRIRDGQISALRAPANRSKLNVLEQDVMRAIGAKIWNDACAAPVNYGVWISEAAYQAEAWGRAMRNMQAFYHQATSRKGIKL